MPKQLTRRATELPVVSWNDWDNVQQVKAAIRGQEMGVFDQPALVVDAMGRDDRISGCLNTRTRAVPALPLTLEPRGDGRQKVAVANELEESFEQMYPNSALSALLKWGIQLGVGLGENVWQYGEKRWQPKLKVWHPRTLTFRQDTRTFWVQTAEGPREVIPGDGQWVLYTPYGLERGWMDGTVRSLYVPWLMRTWGLRDWARYSEVHGHPIKKVVTPAGAEEEDKARFVSEVAAIGTESTIRTPRVAGMGSGDVDRYDLELLEAKSPNWETFQRLLDKAEACIAINICGQNLTTEVKGGSFAAAQTHMAIRNDVLQLDAESLGQCLRDQSIAWWALHNFGSAELAPYPKWKTKQKTPEQIVAKGQGLKNFGEGINALKAAGVKPDIDKMLEEEDVPVTGKADLNAPLPAAAPAPGAADPDGAVPSAKKLPRPTAQASSADDSGLPGSAVEGQLYVDRLGDDGTARYGAVTAKHLKSMLSIVQDSPDYATMRRRLEELYADLDGEEEAELLQQGIIMAELAGRYAARKEAGLSVDPREPDADAEDDE